MNSILVVGSVALDSVETPAGGVREALGGSAVYFSMAARLWARVQLVGVVGGDFPERHRRMLKSKGVGLDGLDVADGKTFRWEGSYAGGFNAAKTLATQLNVFERFRPKLKAAQRAAPVVFLANIDPDLQRDVLAQMRRPHLTACDTMNYWISSKPAALRSLLGQVDVFFVNEDEAKSLSGEPNGLKAARRLGAWGPSVVVVKKGEHGALLYAGGRHYAFPAYPVPDVKDPTGAGDAFAGGFLGYLAARADGRPTRDPRRLKRAMLYGSVLASFDVQGFGTRTLEGLDLAAAQERYKDFVELLSVGSDALAA